jgi:hypothetical protein
MAQDSTKLSGAPFRLSWPAIFGGMFAAAGVWLLFHAFGLALGFSQMDPDNPNLMRAAGIGTGVWSLVGSFLSLLLGGFVTARSAGFLGRGNAAIHGLVLWGLTSLGGTILVVFLLSSLAVGVADAGASVSRSMSLTEQALSVDSSQVLGPVNERLTAQGKPTISAPQLRAAVSDAVMTSVVRGSFDREVFMSSLVEHTDLSQADVRQLFGDLERRIGERTDVAMQQLSHTAERAADMTGRAFWGVFALQLVSLIAAMIGTLAGVSQRQRELSVQVIAGSTSAPLITPSSEAYSR